jgi:hypothetical protein
MVELAHNCLGCFSLAQGVTIVAGLDLVGLFVVFVLVVSFFTSHVRILRRLLTTDEPQVQGVLTVFLGLCVLTGFLLHFL